MELFIFIVLSTLLLAVSFGIAWPLLEIAKKKIAKWKDAPLTRRAIYFAVISSIAVIAAAVAFLDWLFNMTVATIVFCRLPGSCDELLSGRIQGYLYEISEKTAPWAFCEFNTFQIGYMKFIITIANWIDKTPHFNVPEKFTLYF